MTEPILDFIVINPMDITYGSTHRLRQLTSFLRQDGYRVAYIESNYSGSATDIISVPQTNNLFGFLKGTWKRLGYVFRLNYRILFTQTFTPLTAPLILVAKLKGKAVVVDWDDLGYPLQANLLRAYLVKLCEWIFPRICDLIVTPSRYIQSWGQKRGVKKIFHLPHGVDLSLFKLKPKNIILQKQLSLQGRTVLVFLASFTTGGVMDLDVIVEAARRVEQERSKTTLLIIGGGPLFERYHKYISRAGLSNWVMTGYLPQNQIPNYLNLGDIALIFMRDNLANRMKTSLKVLEYLATGKTVIGHLVGETKDRLCRYCHLCGPSASSLAQMIIAVMDKEIPPLETIKPDNYSWEVSRRQLMALLKEQLLVELYPEHEDRN